MCSPSFDSLSTLITPPSTLSFLPLPHTVLKGEASAGQLWGPSIQSVLWAVGVSVRPLPDGYSWWWPQRMWWEWGTARLFLSVRTIGKSCKCLFQPVAVFLYLMSLVCGPWDQTNTCWVTWALAVWVSPFHSSSAHTLPPSCNFFFFFFNSND